MENLIVVILGWLSGTLGQRPIGYIQDSFNKSSLRNGSYSHLELFEAIDELLNTEKMESLMA